MSQYAWATCPELIRDQVDGFVTAVRRCFGDNLIGVYLHGSLAMGCFNPERSDVDLLIVTRDRATVENRRGMAELALRYSSRPGLLELSVVRRSALWPWQYPTPYEFHFSEGWREKFAHALAAGTEQEWAGEPTDPDLAAHVMVVGRRGVCLFGEPIGVIMPEVPRGDYVHSIMLDFDWALERIAANPVYAVLNFCRIYRYLVEGHISSKDEGGVWALGCVPGQFAPVVQQALDIYRGRLEPASFSADSLAAFTSWIQDKVRRLVEMV